MLRIAPPEKVEAKLLALVAERRDPVKFYDLPTGFRPVQMKHNRGNIK